MAADGKTRVTINVPPELARLIAVLAKAEGRSVSNYVTRLLQQNLAQPQAPNPNPTVEAASRAKAAAKNQHDTRTKGERSGSKQ